MRNTPGRFHGETLWSAYGLTPDYQERIETIQGLIPDGVRTLLDVGCGNGNVINALSESNQKMAIVGVDPSLEALRSVKPPAVLAALPNLPFRNHGMDLVLCLQVLEHLTETELVASLGEIQRIARRYIIIGVPYEENLDSKQVLCASCMKTSHVDGHLRRYSDSDMDHLFEVFVVREKRFIGVLQKRPSQAGTWIKQKMAGMYYRADHFLCPYCGSNRAREWKFHIPGFLRKGICFLDQKMTAMKRKKPYWIITLFEQNEMKKPMSGNSCNEELRRIRATYEERDGMMPYDNWGANIYHPRHPIGQLFHEHNHDSLIKALNFLNIDLRTLKVLDVGCGYGYWLRYLVEIGASPSNLTGIDLSAGRIRAAERMNPSITWLHHEDLTLPFASESFDIVMQVLVFSSIADEHTRRILAGEINRVTKPGGRIFWVDQKTSRPGALSGFAKSRALEYFPGGKIDFDSSVHPRYFRRFHGRYAWFARAIYWFTKAGCESWFLIIKKEGTAA